MIETGQDEKGKFYRLYFEKEQNPVHDEEEKKELLENVMNYIQLQKLLAKRLNIVVNY